jgi:hypothetical protein
MHAKNNVHASAFADVGLMCRTQFHFRQAFVNYLSNYRAIVNNLSVTFETNILLYTDITFGLMDWSQSTINVPPASDTMWSNVVALGAELRASDYIGSQRALGSTYFTLCRFSGENFAWFNRLVGAGESMLEVTTKVNCFELQTEVVKEIRVTAGALFFCK